MDTLFLLTILLQLFCTQCYIFELWSIEQFDDMIQSDAYGKSIPARTPAVIALYETECKNKLYRAYGFSDTGLPDTMTLTLSVFDRKLAQNVWFEWMPEIMDAFIRYNLSYIDFSGNVIDNLPQSEWCPTVIWQPADWNENIEIFNLQKDKPFKSWIYNHLVINSLTFINTLDKDVNLLMKSDDTHDKRMQNEMILTQIKAKETVTIKSDDIGFILHAGDTIHAVDMDDNIINRYLLNTIDSKIEIIQTTNREYLTDNQFKKYWEHVTRLRGNRDWSTRRRYLNNIRTPEAMPQFSDTGFKHLKMPDEICTYIQQYAKDMYGNKRKEGFPKDGTQINAREVATYMMHIPPIKKQWIGEILRPMLEEWSGVKLKYSTIYGIREYVKGAVLKTHVDRVETHVISTILHVNHDPIDIPWPIEVVSWDGKRYYIEDPPCTMTFYESAKLIHGRPSTYNGTSWLNAFLHYRPVDWKGYKFTSDNKLITPTNEIPLVDWVYG